MINLLSMEEKGKVKAEYRRRLWSVILLMSLFLFLCVSILLMPSLSSVNFNINQLEKEFDDLTKKPAAENYKEMDALVKEVKSELQILNDQVLIRSRATDAIKEVLKNKPNGVKIENLSWQDEKVFIRLNLAGRASSRESLSKYYDILHSNNSFAEVNLPISDFALSEGAQFSISVVINNKK